MEWININKRLPNLKERQNNWKFLIANQKDEWVDTAYFNVKQPHNLWNNGETEVIPTHWMPLPESPK